MKMKELRLSFVTGFCLSWVVVFAAAMPVSAWLLAPAGTKAIVELQRDPLREQARQLVEKDPCLRSCRTEHVTCRHEFASWQCQPSLKRCVRQCLRSDRR